MAGTYTFWNRTSGASSVGSKTISSLAAQVGSVGDLVTIMVGVGAGGTVTGITDNGSGGSNTWSLAAAEHAGTTPPGAEIWYTRVTHALAAGSTFTVAFSNNSNYFMELGYGGPCPASPLDKTAVGGGTTGTAVTTAATATLTGATDIALFIEADNNAAATTATPQATWTEQSDVAITVGVLHVETQTKVLAATTAISGAATLSHSNLWNAVVATFQVTSSVTNPITLSPTASSSVTLKNQAQKILAATAASAASRSAQVALHLAATAGSSVAITKFIAKALRLLIGPLPGTPLVDAFNTGASQAVTARALWGAFAFFTGETTLTTDSVPTYAGGASSGTYYSNFLSAFTGNDCETWAVLGSTFQDFYLYARIDQTTGNGYYLSYNPATGFLGLNKMTAFVAAGALALVAASPQPGDMIGIRCIGSKIQAWINGVDALTTNDSTYPGSGSNYTALEAQGPVRFDSFGGGNVTGAISVTLTIKRVSLVALAAASSSAAAMIRQAQKLLAPSAPSTPTMSRKASKTLAATASSSATLAAIKVVLLTLAATAGSASTMTRQAQKRLAATSASSASMTRRAGKILAATAASTASMARSVSKTLAATAGSSASFAGASAKHIVLSLGISTSVSGVIAKVLAFPAALRQFFSQGGEPSVTSSGGEPTISTTGGEPAITSSGAEPTQTSSGGFPTL